MERRISNIQQGISNIQVNGQRRQDAPGCVIAVVVHFEIRDSLFDIRYSPFFDPRHT
jgi:hypothetical protein